MCTDVLLDNYWQLVASDPFNLTKSSPVSVSEACCACGGGTTSWQAPNPVVNSRPVVCLASVCLRELPRVDGRWYVYTATYHHPSTVT